MIIKVLDCETFETALISLEKITNLKSTEILNFLYNFDMEDFYDRNPYSDTGDKVLLNEFKTRFKPITDYDQTNWFHLTRVIRSENFKKGILPLKDVIKSKWDAIYNLVSDCISNEEWTGFRKKMQNGLLGHNSNLYKMKTSNSMFDGPYAMLIRETAFNANEMSNHDYLKIPEIIEDILICFEMETGYNLLDRYKKISSPCIVKFRTEFTNPNYLGPVLFYLYNKIHSQKLSRRCNTSYNAHGMKIPPENILNVEYPNLGKNKN